MAGLPAAEAIEPAQGLVAEVLGEAGAGDGEIAGVGMGLPGPVHMPSGELGDSTIRARPHDRRPRGADVPATATAAAWRPWPARPPSC